MTEQELINAGFEKQEAKNAETGNGYDYYYYILELCEGITLMSEDNDRVKDNNWEVRSFDIPALKIKYSYQLKYFIDLMRTITNC